MSEGRDGRRFFVSFIKKRKEGASCFGSFRKEHLGAFDLEGFSEKHSKTY